MIMTCNAKSYIGISVGVSNEARQGAKARNKQVNMLSWNKAGWMEEKLETFRVGDPVAVFPDSQPQDLIIL